MKPEEINYKGYLISNNKNLLSLERIHEFLSRSYWAGQRSKKKLQNQSKIQNVLEYISKMTRWDLPGLLPTIPLCIGYVMCL